MFIEIICTFKGCLWLWILLSLRHLNQLYVKLKKAPTNICKLSFLNKGVKPINVSHTFHNSSVKACLPADIKFYDPSVVDSLTNPRYFVIFIKLTLMQMLRLFSNTITICHFAM